MLLRLVAIGRGLATGGALVALTDNQPRHRLAEEPEVVLRQEAGLAALDTLRCKPLANLRERALIGEAGEVDAGVQAHRSLADRQEGVVIGRSDVDKRLA